MSTAPVEKREYMQTNEKRTVLLSEGSSNSARQVLYGLRKSSIIDILDPAPFCQCRWSALVRRWYRCPTLAKQPEKYLEFLVSQLKKRPYDVLFPTHEQVYLISRFREQLSKLVGLAVPEFSAIRQLQSKATFCRLMADLQIPIPETRIVLSVAEALNHTDFPCYVKLPHSTASLGVVRVDTPRELEAALQRFRQTQKWNEGSEILIQQPARGRQAEVSAVFQHGELIAVSSADVLETGIGGGPAFRVSVQHDSVIPCVKSIGKSLSWHGPMVLEYFFDRESGQPEFIEANPRIGEAFNTMLAGVNLSEMVADLSQGKRFENLVVGRPGARTHNGFILLIADGFNGANRRQLIKRLFRHWLQRGEYRNCESEITKIRDDFGSIIPATVVTLGLLAKPSYANKLTQDTVANYSLPHAAVQKIESMRFPELPERESE